MLELVRFVRVIRVSVCPVCPLFVCPGSPVRFARVSCPWLRFVRLPPASFYRYRFRNESRSPHT